MKANISIDGFNLYYGCVKALRSSGSRKLEQLG